MAEEGRSADRSLLRDLRRAVCRMLDEPTDETAHALAAMLRDCPDLQNEYVRLMQCEAALDEIHARHVLDELQTASFGPANPPGDARGLSEASIVGAQRPRPVVERAVLADLGNIRAWAGRRPNALAWAMAAAVIALGAGYLVWPRNYATLLAADGVEWIAGSHYDVGERLGDEWVELQAGTIQISYHKGATMKIDGPARFRAAGRLRCQLKSGSAVVFVPPSATGFAVETPELVVVDVGTSFRVDAAESGASKVHVLDGVVDVSTAGENSIYRLTAGDIAAADRSDSRELTVLSADALQPRTSNRIAFRAKHPPALGPHGFRGDDRCYVFLERAGFVLPHALAMNCIAAGPHSRFADLEGTVPAKTVVDCYLVHCAPNQTRNVVAGTITFRGEILGIISSSDKLNATNELFGSPWTLSCQHPERGFETEPDQNADRLTISPDRRTLSIDLRTATLDQLRVLVRTAGP